MLTEDEYEPLHSELALPSMDEYLPVKGKPYRVIKVRVKKVGDEKPVSLVSHIQRPRDKEWECVEGEFEGTFNMPTDPMELYKKLRPKIPKKFLDSTDDYIKSFTSKSHPYYDENGKFMVKPDYEKMYGEQSATSKIHKKLLNFLETQDLKVLFPDISNDLK